MSALRRQNNSAQSYQLQQQPSQNHQQAQFSHKIQQRTQKSVGFSEQIADEKNSNQLLSPGSNPMSFVDTNNDVLPHNHQLQNKAPKSKVFVYEKAPHERNQQSVYSIQNVNAGNNLQYTQSPQRANNQEYSADQLQKLKLRSQTKQEATVRGRRLADKEVDVICLQQSQDSDRYTLSQNENLIEQKQFSLANQENIQPYNQLKFNSQSYQFLPMEMNQFSQYSSGVSQQQTQRDNNSKHSYNELARKGSVDSKLARQKSSSQGREEQRPKKSSSSSAQRSKIETNKKPKYDQKSIGKTLRRPLSTKNLKQSQSQASNLQHIPNSPSLNQLHKNQSLQQLPPKPQKISQRNKCVTSVEKQQADEIKASASESTFSPLRRKHKEFHSTMPTSTQKPVQVKKSIKKENQSKSKSRRLFSAQILSPNVQKVKVGQIIQEKLDQLQSAQNPSFEESEINNRQSIEDDGYDHSQISIKEQEKQLQKTNTLKNYYQDIFKTIKQQMSTLNHKKEKQNKQGEEKGKLNTDRTGKINLEQMKLKMNKKLEGKSLGFKKKPIQVAQNDIEIARLKKMETREEWQKQRELRQECFEMVKDALTTPQGLTTKRELSKSQQRPVTQKVSQSQQQVSIKVPVVLNERVGKFGNSIQTKQRKHDEIKEILKECKKDKALRTLEDQYKKQFDQFKQNLIAGSKIKIRQLQPSKPLGQEQQTIKAKRKRSKNKKHQAIEEKKNREAFGSISPGRNLRTTTVSPSENRQIKKKKITLHSTSSVAQLKIMTKNVKEILALQKDDEKIKKMLKSQTLKDFNQRSLKVKNKDQILTQRDQSQQQQQFFQKSNASSFNQIQLEQQYPEFRQSYEQQRQQQNMSGSMQFRISNNSSQNMLFQQPSDSISMQIGGISANITPVRENNQQTRYPVTNQLKSSIEDPRFKSTEFKTLSFKDSAVTSSLKCIPPNEKVKQESSVNGVKPDTRLNQENIAFVVQNEMRHSQKNPFTDGKINFNRYPDEFYVGSALIIQGYIRKFIAIKKVRKLQNEKNNLAKAKEIKQQKVNQHTNDASIDQRLVYSSPLRTSYDAKVKKITIINDNSHNQELSSIISHHSINNFKQIPHFEDEKFGINFRKDRNEQYSSQVGEHNIGLNSIRQKQDKVQERIDYQNKINEQAQNDALQIKSMAILQSSSSNNNRQLVQNKSSQKYFQQKEQRQNKLAHNSDFDSLSSLIKLSKDFEVTEGDKKLAANQPSQQKGGHFTDRTEDNKRDSFLIQVIQKLNDQSNQKQNKNLNQTNHLHDESLMIAEKRGELQYHKIGNTSGISQRSKILFLNPSNGRNENNDSQIWNLSGRQRQEYSERGSQILQEESKKQISTLSVTTHQKSKLIQNKLNVFEEMLEELTLEANKGREKLKKLDERRHLSPSSQKKKLELEKWVTKQEKQLIKQKKWYMENVDDMIQKIDKDIKNTRNLIDTKRSNTSNIFNNSIEMSCDMSINNTQSQHSFHCISTPKVAMPVVLNNEINLPVQITDKVAQKLPFEYKEPLKQEEPIKPIQILIHRETLQSQRSTDPIINDDHEQMGDHSTVMKQDKIQSDHNISEPRITIEEKEQNNIFNDNLASQHNISINLSHIKLEDDDMKMDNDTSSLSQMDPPQFQLPMMSTVSHKIHQNEQISEEEMIQREIPQDLQKILCDNQQPEAQDQEQEYIQKSQEQLDFDIDQKIAEGEKQLSEQRLSSSLLINDIAETKEEQKLLQEAFSSLKEPKHQHLMQDIKQQHKYNDDIEQQTEQITDYILQALMEQIRFNMYPKRAYIEQKSDKLGKDKSQQQEYSPTTDQVQSEKDLAALPVVSTESLKDLNKAEQNNEESLFQDLEAKDTEVIAQKQKLRGIKTSIRIVDNYVAEIFKKIKESEDEFVENLSTPLNKDPLEILLHLQNVYIDADMENAMAFQQSVLPVDLYLELERNKQSVQKVDTSTDEEPTNKSMLAEWENIHNKVIFDGINEAFDNFRPYGLKGPPMPWSQQTRTLTYKNGQQVDNVLKQVRQKVIEWSRTFSGALPCSELLLEYGIRGPLDDDKLNLLREERLALVLAQEIEENEQLWTDYEYEETQTKLDVADMILEVLAEEAVKQFNDIKEARGVVGIVTEEAEKEQNQAHNEENNESSVSQQQSNKSQ